MALHEMRYLHQHPAVIRILLGILVVPLVYAVTFLASVWNPYGELQHLPMAVVNQDRPVTGMAWGRQVDPPIGPESLIGFSTNANASRPTAAGYGARLLGLTDPTRGIASVEALTDGYPTLTRNLSDKCWSKCRRRQDGGVSHD